MQQGLPLPSRRPTLGQYLEDWLGTYEAPSVAPQTLKDYRQIVKNHIAPALGKLTLEQVTPQRIQSLLNEKHAGGLAPRSVQYVHAVLRAALRKAVEWNLVARNAALAAKPPRVTPKEVQALTLDQAKAILEAFKGQPLEALVTTALALGLRQGEVLGLRWSDLDLDTGAVEVRYQVERRDGVWTFAELKTEKSRRTLPLPPFLVTALREHRARQLEHRLALGPQWTDLNLVFPNPWGLPRSGSRVTHDFQDQLARARLSRMRFHDLRHGAATLMRAQGADLRTIMEVLGHSTISITANLYTHIAPEVKRATADRMQAALGG